STFYGVLLDNAPYNASTPWFHGQVVDMFYIVIWEGRVAVWVPIWGGKYIALWPIFNIADESIFVGVAIILIFQKRFFVESPKVTVTEGTTQQKSLDHPAKELCVRSRPFRTEWYVTTFYISPPVG